MTIAAQQAHATEVRPVRDEDRDRFDDIRESVRTLGSASQAAAANADLAARLVVEHEGRIAALEESRVALQRADINVRVETNDALRDMAEKIGAVTEIARNARFALSLIALSMAVMAALQLLDRFGGAR